MTLNKLFNVKFNKISINRVGLIKTTQKYTVCNFK